MQSLEERLARLERKNKALMAIAGLALLVAGLAPVVALSPRHGSAAEVVTVRGLRIVDDQGTVRAELAPTARGEFGLLLSDAQSKPRAFLGLGTDGSPRLGFATPAGASLVDLTAFANAAPRLALANPEGNEFFQVSLESDGSARLALADPLGRPRAILNAHEDGSPELLLVDRLGVPRAELRVSDTNRPSLRLEDEHGNVFKAPEGNP